MALKTQIAFTTVLSVFLMSSGIAAIAKPTEEPLSDAAPETVLEADLEADPEPDLEADLELSPEDPASAAEASETEVLDVEITPIDPGIDPGIDPSISRDPLAPLETEASDLGAPASDSADVVPEASTEESPVLEADPLEADPLEADPLEETLEETQEEIQAETPIDPAEAQDPSQAEQDERSLQLKQSAKLSLQDALDIVESIEAEAAGQARSAVFIGELDQPIIAIEVGMQAIAIDANGGEVLGVQNISDIPDREIWAAAEANSQLKSLAKITLKEALQAAETFTGQAPQQMALGLDDGSLVYRATVADQQVFIDAGDAQVLYSSGDSFEAAEKPSGSIQVPTLEN